MTAEQNLAAKIAALSADDRALLEAWARRASAHWTDSANLDGLHITANNARVRLTRIIRQIGEVADKENIRHALNSQPLTIETSKQLREALAAKLAAKLATGLYGRTIEEVAERILCERLRP